MGFCENCGAELNGEQFCPSCGAEVPATEVTNTTANAGFVGTALGFLKSKVGIMAVAGVVGLGVIILILCLVFRPGYGKAEKAAEAYMAAVVKCDAKKAVKTMPNKIVKGMVKEEYGGNKKEFIAEVQEKLDDKKENYEDQDMDIAKIKYEVYDTERISSMELKSLEMGVEMMYNKKIKAKEGKNVEIMVKYPGNDYETTYTIPTVKIGGRWYALPSDIF